MRATCSRRLLSMLATALVVAVAGSTEMSAQRFQVVYGSAACVEAGRAGVVQLAGGGYAATGESWSNAVGACQNAPHIYVIYTLASGARAWANVYSIGSKDSALDIVELADGSLVICGVTTAPMNCNPSRDAFLLKLNNAGVVLAVHTYGRREFDEIAWNLTVTQTGDGITTNPGDLIVAGSTTFNAGMGRDGYIFRTTPNLALIWGHHYGGPQSMDDYFYGIDECRVGVAGGTTGDIVAVGGTTTWTVGGTDIWILRVNGNNGGIGAPPENGATYGRQANDEGRAIIELQNGPSAGDLVVTGISFSRPMPSTNSEVAMLETGANPCMRVADMYAGDNAGLADGGMDLKEDQFPTMAAGNVIVTGYTALGPLMAPPNAFLQKFVCGAMAPVPGGGMAYGGNGIDWGWSVNNCGRVSPTETQGYVVAGFTQSANLIGADPQQLYMFKTDLALSSGDATCGHDTAFTFNCAPPLFLTQCPAPFNEVMNDNCIPNRVSWQLLPWTSLCYALPQARDNGGNGNDGASGVERPAVITFKEGSVSSYPNPVPGGAPLNLRFDLSTATQADVTVSDIVGRVVHEERLQLSAGTELKVIPTKGWMKGTYIVRVVIGEKSSTTKIVLSD